MKYKDFVKAHVEALKNDPSLGEMTAIYAKDDEGNGHNRVVYAEPFPGVYDGERDGEFISDKDELKEYFDDGETLNAVCVN